MSPWHEMIGVVQDDRENGVDRPWRPPSRIGRPCWRAFPARDVGPPRHGLHHSQPPHRIDGFLKDIQQAVWSVNANLPLAKCGRSKTVYDKSLARTSFTLVMLAIAGSMALRSESLESMA